MISQHQGMKCKAKEKVNRVLLEIRRRIALGFSGGIPSSWPARLFVRGSFYWKNHNVGKV